ncbi:MAG: hypothetical protein O7A03_04425 [Alphaproteobacteria bacterium]|nr:hypothetical protein [Alphaproteobacteria bacterium]
MLLLFLVTPTLDKVGLSPIKFWVAVAALPLSYALPLQSDETTVFEAVDADGRVVVLTYRFDMSRRNSMSQDYLVKLRKWAIDHGCNDSWWHNILWAGGEMSYRFIDGRGHPVAQIDIDFTNCV